jgi:hypothetical protein
LLFKRYGMERLQRAHACEDSMGLGIGGGVPRLGDMGGSRVECVVSFVIERDSLQAIFCFLNV